MEVNDVLGWEGNEAVKNQINNEKIYYTNKIQKKNKAFFAKTQERNIVITDEAIYNFKGTTQKRRIPIKSLIGVTITEKNNQFIIHGNREEYDYLLISPDRKKIISILQNLYESATNQDLLFSSNDCKDLSKMVVSKKQKKKSPELSKIDKQKLQSIKEYLDEKVAVEEPIEQEENIINTNTKAIDEFKKDNKFKSGVTFEQFEIISLIGQGHTANIYLASYNGGMVALKVFDKAYLYQNDLIEKVLLEKNILSSYNDEEFIIHMKFYFMTNEKICFVLPFYPGGDLYSLLEANGPFDESIAAFYAVQIAHMINFLHSKNIIYRDLKLENLLVDENGYLVLTDFGSCKMVEDKNELECSFDGSVDYMSPELISGEGYGFMTDWWSYGILIYELLYGIPPFHEGSTDRILDLITNSNVRYPSKINLSANTKDFINRLLKKSPKDRLGQNFKTIFSQPFFVNSNVNSILNRKYISQITPTIVQENPIFNFDNLYTNKKIEVFTKSYDNDILDNIQNYFEEFENKN